MIIVTYIIFWLAIFWLAGERLNLDEAARSNGGAKDSASTKNGRCA